MRSETQTITTRSISDEVICLLSERFLRFILKYQKNVNFNFHTLNLIR